MSKLPWDNILKRRHRPGGNYAFATPPGNKHWPERLRSRWIRKVRKLETISVMRRIVRSGRNK